MEKKDIDWETLLNFNYDNSDIDLNDLEIYKNDKQLDIYEKDYKALVSIESILKNKCYYQTKYFIIMKHLINMDDFYLTLENIPNNKFEESVKTKSFSSSKSKNSSKIFISSGNEVKKDLNTFKLGYTKQLLNIFENEKMTLKEFEEYAKRNLYLMFLMIKKNNYVIYNPKKRDINILSSFLGKYSEKKESYNNVKKDCEIDVVINP